MYVLIRAVITQIFDPIAQLVISTGTPTKEAKVEMKIMHPVTAETGAQYFIVLLAH